MRLALKEAEKGLYTFTNPRVGCVIVKNGRMVSKGFHNRFGGPHAEIAAIEKAGETLKGAAMYITLEPCAHYGKTPPCAERIVKEGIKTVFIAMKDPNPVVAGKGIRYLNKHGVKTETGILAREAELQNQPYLKGLKKRMPYIAVKYAMTLDGKIALSDYSSKYVTSEAARNYSKNLRDRFDAIMVGTNTLLHDNPVLEGLRKKPVKIIVDRTLKLPLSHNIFRDAADRILCTSEKNKKKLLLTRCKFREIIFVREKNKGLDLEEMFKKLYRENIGSIFVEGGSKFLGSLFDGGLVDYLYSFISFKIFGGEGSLSPVSGRGVKQISDAGLLKAPKINIMKDEILVEGRMKEYVYRDN